MAYTDELSDTELLAGDVNSQIVDQLKEDRQAAGVSQKVVANAIGYTDGVIKNIESGRTKVTIDTLLRLCIYYKKTIYHYLPKCRATKMEVVDLGEAAEPYLRLSYEEKELIKKNIIALDKAHNDR